MSHALPKLQLSDPLITFVQKMLEKPESVSIFTSLGGIEVVCQSLVRSNRVLITMQPGLVSIIMQHLSKTPRPKLVQPPSQPMSCHEKKSFYKVYDDDVINFSPYCTITTESTTAQSPEVLMQAPIASHRRARTPAWTYLFYPTETYIDLHIALPTAVLLKEIQLQPHTPSLFTSPSAVALEINRDNVLAPIPISQPMSTVGLTCIRLRLPQPEIASSIVLRLYRPKDSNNIGLSQISVLGSTVFTRSPIQIPPTNTSLNPVSNNVIVDVDIAAKTSLRWLRILTCCFHPVTADGDTTSALLAAVIQSAADYPGFLEACCSLLNVTNASGSLVPMNLEDVLLTIGLYNRELGLKLIEMLLRNTQPQTLKLCNDLVSDLLYNLCTIKDENTCDRIAAMINWIQTFYANQTSGITMRSNPYSGFVKCLAAILWSTYHAGLETELQSLITEQFFSAVFSWSEQLRDKEPLKQAVDALLCSICCIRPELFPHLLQRMGVLIANHSTRHDASISDDRKDTDGMTDDTKQATSSTGEWYSHLVIQDISKLALTPVQLKTIAMACQSPLAIAQLLDSGLPYLLSMAILEFCNQITQTTGGDQPMTDADKARPSTSSSTASFTASSSPLITVDMISEILDFFAESCSEGTMRDWLGSPEGSLFWNPLLNMLCNERPADFGASDRMFSFSKLEAATIHFLSRVTSCHPKNQEQLTLIMIAVIRHSAYTPSASTVVTKNIISGFTRRLVLQLLLESERILVVVRSKRTLNKQKGFAEPINHHPSKRAHLNNMLFYVSTHTKCQEILNGFTYSSPTGNAFGSDESVSSGGLSDIVLNKMPSWTDKPMGGGADTLFKKQYMEFALGSGMEFLSMAAGVTAKDKRLKDEKNKAAAAAAAAQKIDVFVKSNANRE